MALEFHWQGTFLDILFKVSVLTYLISQMNGNEGENTLDNKMLYELHNIHAWEQQIQETRPILKDVILSSCEKAYQKISDTPVASFLQCYSNPTISHDGEFVALISNSVVEIRDKESSFSLLAEIDIDVQNKSVIRWSSNCNYLGVCVDGSEIVVYDVQGNVVQTCHNVGSPISTFDFLLDDGLNFLVISGNGLLFSHYTSEKRWFNFEFEDPVVEMMCISGSNMIITTHMEAAGTAYG